MLHTRSAPPTGAADPVRVMVVDDSAVVRGLLARWLAEDGLTVVGSFRNGREAVQALDRTVPDVVLLDVEMPEMDGLTALPLILDKAPGAQVVMASTLTRRNAEVTLKALAGGASDYVPKPEAARGIGHAAEFRREVVEKARQLGLRARRLGAVEPDRPFANRVEAALLDVADDAHRPTSCQERVTETSSFRSLPPFSVCSSTVPMPRT
jgi:two-component system chemotaxis response regulator CheB